MFLLQVFGSAKPFQILLDGRQFTSQGIDQREPVATSVEVWSAPRPN